MVLVGPSGCGKTTTLRMTAGLEEISEGEIRIGDQVVNSFDPRERDVAMVFQNYALYPHMSVFDNLSFPLRAHGVAKDEIRTRVERVAKLLELDELLRRKPRALSGRSAPARGHGARDRSRAAGVPDGRAALEPRRATAHADAR